MSDLISLQAAIDKFIDGLEKIFADIRERHVDDSVCGLCEYDGAYLGQSGDWCNECPGFEKDDCFKLSDKIRKKWTDEIIKALPSAHTKLDEWCTDCKEYDQERHCCPRYNRVIRETLAEIREAPSAEPEADKVARDIATIIENEKDMRIILADERLEPKKPRVHRIHFSYKPDELIVQCPNCKRRLKSQLTVTNPYAYCPKCGQAIDWSEEK